MKSLREHRWSKGHVMLLSVASLLLLLLLTVGVLQMEAVGGARSLSNAGGVLEEQERGLELLSALAPRETLRAYEDIVADYYANIMPSMGQIRLKSNEEYIAFAENFAENRRRMVELREGGGWGEVRMAFITSGQQLARRNDDNPARRVDLTESIIIEHATIERQLELSLASNFQAGEGAKEYAWLAENFCTEEKFFCLNKPWLELAVGMGVDFAVVWKKAEGWAADYHRLRDYDVLVMLDYVQGEIRSTLRAIKASSFQGAIVRMPSESHVMNSHAKIRQIIGQPYCHILLDNYWIAPEALGGDGQLYPLWFRYPMTWRSLAATVEETPSLERKYAFVAKVTNRRAESDRYRQERKEAADFFESLGYEVNSADGDSVGGYFDYFSRCKYAFLPMVERNSTGQIIADCIISSNFTTLPFSYNHKLWMRALPPFLTISSVAELKEKIHQLEADDELYMELLEMARQYAMPFMDASTLETKEEMLAAVMLAPWAKGEKSRRCDCYRQRVPGMSQCPSLSLP